MAKAAARRAASTPYLLHGRPRDFRRVFWTGLLTLGVGWAVFWFRAFRELDVQMGRRHNSLFFLSFIPVLGMAFAAVYVHREYVQLLGDLDRLGLSAPGTAREVTAWIVPGVLILVGPAFAARICNQGLNAVWRELAERGGVPAPGV